MLSVHVMLTSEESFDLWLEGVLAPSVHEVHCFSVNCAISGFSVHELFLFRAFILLFSSFEPHTPSARGCAPPTPPLRLAPNNILSLMFIYQFFRNEKKMIGFGWDLNHSQKVERQYLYHFTKLKLLL